MDNPFLSLIARSMPPVCSRLTYRYAMLWFTTTLFAAPRLSVLATVASRAPERVRPRPLPPYPDPASRPTPSLVLGEAHLARTYGPASNPTC